MDMLAIKRPRGGKGHVGNEDKIVENLPLPTPGRMYIIRKEPGENPVFPTEKLFAKKVKKGVDNWVSECYINKARCEQRPRRSLRTEQ